MAMASKRIQKELQVRTNAPTHQVVRAISVGDRGQRERSVEPLKNKKNRGAGLTFGVSVK